VGTSFFIKNFGYTEHDLCLFRRHSISFICLEGYSHFNTFIMNNKSLDGYSRFNTFIMNNKSFDEYTKGLPSVQEFSSLDSTTALKAAISVLAGTAGVYYIKCKLTGMVYIGSSNSLSERRSYFKKF
jgi:hypothetical protein